MKNLIKIFILSLVISCLPHAALALTNDVDLTWDANSQAPASYKGKLLPTQNSTINISALPFIYWPGSRTLIANNNLIFNWHIDDKFSAGNSGAGKSNLIFTVNNYAGGRKLIRLEIKTSDGAVSISKNIEIPIARPQVFIHLADSKTGFPYGAALKNLTVSPISLNFVAQNYFFNTTPNNLRWQWLVDGKEVGSGSERPWLASLNLINRGPLLAQIQTIVKNSSNELETAQSTINLEVK
ncbi:hypothetical protein KKH14_03110 [Patescibacteria group bacterium]|nr:hypothetical protein [Patescibacteria group bacterium]